MSQWPPLPHCPGGSHQGILIYGSGLTLLAAALVAACAAAPTEPTLVPLPETEPPAPTETFPAPTSTPGPISIWASPGLPDELLQQAALLTEVGGRPLVWTADPLAADLRLEPNAEFPLSRWIYALTAAFPTLEQGISRDELRQIWSGEQPRRIYVPGETGVALASLLGAAGGELRVEAADRVLELAWQDRQALAIVPFEALEPRWKVLDIDGRSPVRSHFTPEGYLLAVEFGLSGDSSLFGAIGQALAWPGTNRDPGRLTTVLMTGVTALVRGTAYRMNLHTPEYPAFRVGDWLREADLTHISNEVSFYRNCPEPDPFSSSLRFCAAVDHLALLELTEIDLVELTGNHLLDYGAEPFLESLARYRDLGIQTFGGGADLAAALEPAIVEHNANRLAFIGCNAAGPPGDWASEIRPGAMPCDDERVLERVGELRNQGYLVVFTFQWPESVSPQPLPNQREAFRAAIDAGAVIVSGSQAHRPQTMEFYDGGFIHYGLGNLFFDQMHNLSYRQEFLDRHVFYDGRHISTELLTALLEDYAQPRPMSAAERSALLEEIYAASGW